MRNESCGTAWTSVGCIINCMVFNIISTVFQLYHSGQSTYPCFPRVLLTSAPTIFFPSHWLLSHKNIVKTTDRGERGMNLSQWLSSILGKKICWAGIKPEISCSDVHNSTNWHMGLGSQFETTKSSKIVNQALCCGYSLEGSRREDSNEYLHHRNWQRTNGLIMPLLFLA